MRLAFVIMLTATAILFARQVIGAFEVGVAANLGEAARALWGAFFTSASFLTTAGFISADWIGTRDWSGLPAPGLILIGLAIMGGGVATTAGGVKLLRLYALARHGQNEIERLPFPSLVTARGTPARRMHRDGMFLAWVFFMVFAVTGALFVLGLTALGSDFEEAILYAAAALSNTGPLIVVASDEALSMMTLSDPAKMLICLGMVLGRLEVLALLALANAEMWRG
ncbi:MAG: potassium transporter TrkG [Pseudomonadota bacterium]